MMLVDGKIIANNRVSSQRVFGKLGNVIAQGSMNMMSEIGGEGVGPSRHTGGSLSHMEHAKRLVRILINIWIFFFFNYLF